MSESEKISFLWAIEFLPGISGYTPSDQDLRGVQEVGKDWNIKIFYERVAPESVKEFYSLERIKAIPSKRGMNIALYKFLYNEEPKGEITIDKLEDDLTILADLNIEGIKFVVEPALPTVKEPALPTAKRKVTTVSFLPFLSLLGLWVLNVWVIVCVIMQAEEPLKEGSYKQVPKQIRKEVVVPPNDIQKVVQHSMNPKVNKTPANKNKPHSRGEVGVVGVLSDISGKVAQYNEGEVKGVECNVSKAVVDVRKCEHGKWKRTCKDCGGSAICVHKKQSKFLLLNV